MQKMRWRQRILISLLMAAVAGGLQLSKWSEPLDRLLYDTAVKAFPSPVSDDILVVTIDEKSLLELGRWPWPRHYHTDLLAQLSTHEVSVVGFDILFAERSRQSPESDIQFAEQVAQAGNVVLPVFIESIPRSGQHLEILPIAELAVTASELGHVHVHEDIDGKSRSVYLMQGLGNTLRPHFAVAIQGVSGSTLGELPGLSSGNDALQNSDLQRTYKNLIPFVGGAGSFTTISYVDVLKQRIPKQQLMGKTVLVGVAAQGMDRFSTPVGLMSGVELNANILQALHTSSFIQPTSEVLSLWFAVIVSGLLTLLLTGMTGRHSTVVLMVVLGLLSVMSVAQIAMFIWLPVGALILSLVLCYPLLNWLRLRSDVAVLGRELVRLNRQDVLANSQPLVAEVVGSVHFLNDVFPVKGWTVLNAQREVADSWGGAPSVFETSTESDCWQHKDDCSVRAIRGAKDECHILINWHTRQQLPTETLDRFFPVEMWAKQKPNANQAVIASSILNLTDANQRAEYSNKLLWESLGQLQDGVLLVECSGRVVKINEQAKHLLNTTGEYNSLLRCLDSISLYNRGGWRELLQELLLQETPFTVEGRSVNGKDVQCQGRIIHVGRPLALLVIADITTLKQSERARAEAMDFLSHDLRAPMTSVLALIESAKSDGRKGVNSQLLKRIEQYVRKNISYADNYIHLSKAENHSYFFFEDCLIDSVVDDAVSQVFHLAKGRGVKLKVQHSNEELWVNGDRTMLERAVVNLIDNAIKYGREGGTVRVSVTSRNNRVLISVADDGEGISTEDMHNLFEAFHQGRNKNQAGHSGIGKGVGLGLRLVATVAQKHMGEVSVDTKFGEGSVFSINLPIISVTTVSGW